MSLRLWYPHTPPCLYIRKKKKQKTVRHLENNEESFGLLLHLSKLRRTYSIRGSESGVNTKPATIMYDGWPPSIWYGTYLKAQKSNEVLVISLLGMTRKMLKMVDADSCTRCTRGLRTTWTFLCSPALMIPSSAISPANLLSEIKAKYENR